jgi:hypothetical protein
MHYVSLQRFALKPEPRNFLKVLQSYTFKKFLVVRLIGNCCNYFNRSINRSHTLKSIGNNRDHRTHRSLRDRNLRDSNPMVEASI